MTALCPVCGGPEARARCCWPMPESPLDFFTEDGWDDELDAEILADRLGGGVLYEEDVVALCDMKATAMLRAVHRGRFPRMVAAPDNNEQRRWRARDIAPIAVGRA